MVRPRYQKSNKFFNSITEITRQNFYTYEYVSCQLEFRWGVQFYFAIQWPLKIVDVQCTYEKKNHGNEDWPSTYCNENQLNLYLAKQKREYTHSQHSCLHMHATIRHFTILLKLTFVAYCSVTNGTSWIIQKFCICVCVRTANGPINKSLGFVDK